VSISLILGGARSGKSGRAEALANESGLPVIYVATAPYLEGDEAWAARIEQHREKRPAHWQTLEDELELTRLIEQQARAGTMLLVDCLTLWLFNLMQADRDADAEAALLCKALQHAGGDVVLVSSEVGMGLVPESGQGREFRDAQGRLNQAVAAVANRVEFITAGLPLILKGD